MRLKIHKIIGFSLALTLAGGVMLLPAQAEPVISEVVNNCLEDHEIFRQESPFELSEDALDTPLGFRKAFEQARTEYHEYLECIFDGAVKNILGSSGADTDGFWSANSPNIPEWSRPDVACLDPADIKKVNENTESAALLPAVLKAHNAYAKHLEQLYQKHSVDLFIDIPFEEAEAMGGKARLLITNEIQNARAGIHSAFAQLSDLRLVFMMHVQFQCMLHSLEEYRRLLSDLRSVILALPARLIDASQTR